MAEAADEPKNTSGRGWLIAIGIAAVVVVLSMLARGDDDSGGGANLDFSVVSRIKAETNCSALQREVDTRKRLTIYAERGSISAINGERSVAYMKLADDRMQEIGCWFVHGVPGP